MNKQLKSFLYILSCFTFIACNQVSKEEAEFDAVMQQIIDVHDEVMPKMGEISSLIQQLTPKIDTTAIGQSHLQAQTGLKKSYDFMMDWMSDFSTKFPHGEPVTTDNPEVFKQKMKLLLEEKTEVDALKTQIHQSITTAKQVLATPQ